MAGHIGVTGPLSLEDWFEREEAEGRARECGACGETVPVDDWYSHVRGDDCPAISGAAGYRREYLAGRPEAKPPVGCTAGYHRDWEHLKHAMTGGPW